jgi:rubrerythrin
MEKKIENSEGYRDHVWEEWVWVCKECGITRYEMEKLDYYACPPTAEGDSSWGDSKNTK